MRHRKEATRPPQARADREGGCHGRCERVHGLPRLFAGRDRPDARQAFLRSSGYDRQCARGCARMSRRAGQSGAMSPAMGAQHRVEAGARRPIASETLAAPSGRVLP